MSLWVGYVYIIRLLLSPEECNFEILIFIFSQAIKTKEKCQLI